MSTNQKISVGQLSASGSANGQILASNGTTVYWTSGGTGYNGSVGFTGSTGSTGFTGSLGFTGSQGNLGYSGSKGDTGVIGFTGSQGGTGYIGSQGSLGYTGSIGYTGSAGIGYAGSIGSLGYTGSIGFTGSVGTSANVNINSYTFTGNGSNTVFTLSNQVTQNTVIISINGVVQAPTTSYTITDANTNINFVDPPGANTFIEVKVVSGGIGYTGSQGPAGGYTGSQGGTGYTGSIGSLGYTGSTGAGFVGSQGGTGYVGSKGDLGFTGSAGTNGYTGSFGYTGSVGFVGSQGGTGYTGSTGSQGTTGFTGSLGYTGSFGSTGYTGSTGSQGTTGFVGSFGYSGSKGDTGFVGSQGPAGTFGGAAFNYNYSTNTTHTSTPDGYLNFSNTILSSANQLYIDYVDALGANVYSFLQTIDDSTSSIKGHFSIKEAANTLNYAMFSIVGSHTEETDHFNVPISYLSGTTSFTNGTNTIITFARTGDIGDKGYTGSVGFTGSIGSLGYTGSAGAGFVGSVGYTGSAANFDINDNTFTGNGSNTQFTLSSATTQNSVLVTVNGLTLIPSTEYTISGSNTVIVFTEAPALSDVINVKIVTGGVTTVGYTGSAGSGATTSTDDIISLNLMFGLL